MNEAANPVTVKELCAVIDVLQRAKRDLMRTLESMKVEDREVEEAMVDAIVERRLELNDAIRLAHTMIDEIEGQE